MSNTWPKEWLPLDCSRGELNIIMERPVNLRTPMTRLPLSTVATLALCAVPALMTEHAAAHIRMDQPVARNVWAAQPFNDPIKQGPCGSGANDPRSTDPAKINTFAPGETITVSWEETVDHPGFYRIAIDMDGQDDFVDPAGPTDIKDPPVLPVLMDGITDMTDGTYSVEVTLPNETCDNCTLQLIQYMTDKDESYYICADLVIEGPVSGDGDGDGTGGTNDTTTEPTEGAGGALVASGGSISSGGSVASGGASVVPQGSGGQASGVGGSATTGETGSEGPGPSGDDEVESGAGCSVSRTVPAPGSAIAWLCGLVALTVVGARRRIRR